jgi:hypothetical protein
MGGPAGAPEGKERPSSNSDIDLSLNYHNSILT